MRGGLPGVVVRRVFGVLGGLRPLADEGAAMGGMGTETPAAVDTTAEAPGDTAPDTTKARAHLREPGPLAVEVGFEPTVGCPTLAFEASALGH